ncbi:testis-expressed protein 26 isoform X2 [Erinaceus europaeus]|uniref:Testis-expressed protein 26 isoform X2 n=1 Tax=Erinaceus europaeus TaxID=9365 RepID=A0ABM3XFN1_ERIEU|nr:testis-expressed protein 26 isoform X2 [Erinaceus europaeus]
MAWRCTENPCSVHQRKFRLSDNNWDSYTTTMKAAFTPKTGTRTTSLRPKTIRSENPYTFGFNQTHYNEEYVWKARSKEDWIKTGPIRTIKYQTPPSKQDFFLWTLPQGNSASVKSTCPWKFETMEKIKKAIANQFVSHTRRDFVDRANVQNMKKIHQKFPDWKTLIPRPAETEFRRNYQFPPHVPEFQDFSLKYGCYSSLQFPSRGADREILNRFIRSHCDFGEKVK